MVKIGDRFYDMENGRILTPDGVAGNMWRCFVEKYNPESDRFDDFAGVAFLTAGELERMEKA